MLSEKPRLLLNTWYFTVQHAIFFFFTRPSTAQNRWIELMIYWWRACLHNKASLSSLTPTTTVSSDWNLGRNWSPRKISDWLRGRKRHSTFMLHSAGVSAIAQIQGGCCCCCFLRRGKMLLRLEAIGRWCEAWSDCLDNKKRRADAEKGLGPFSVFVI